jgi:hypothetical protein
MAGSSDFPNSIFGLNSVPEKMDFPTISNFGHQKIEGEKSPNFLSSGSLKNLGPGKNSCNPKWPPGNEEQPAQGERKS